MAGPRVFVLYFGASFSDLLNHEVRGMSLDHGFDARLFVAGDQHEARGIRRDPVILRRCELDCLDATRRGALAMEWERLAHAMLLRSFLDPLVNRAKHLFVVRRTFREVHSRHSPSLRDHPPPEGRLAGHRCRPMPYGIGGIHGGRTQFGSRYQGSNSTCRQCQARAYG